MLKVTHYLLVGLIYSHKLLCGYVLVLALRIFILSRWFDNGRVEQLHSNYPEMNFKRAGGPKVKNAFCVFLIDHNSQRERATMCPFNRSKIVDSSPSFGFFK